MKRHAPATTRNSGPIAAVFEAELPACGTVLEIASGSGEHAVFFARRFPNLSWQPSDLQSDALASIAAWRAEENVENLLAPIPLDASAAAWPIEHADALVCINMVHISPWAATEGLFAGAAVILPKGAPLIAYGPFIEPEVETAESNLAFGASLRARDPAWGLRNRTELDALAYSTGFVRSARYPMPANNVTLVYRRS
ncbi:DUF938 domain-containing protein [Pelagerythrobacter rhizovicinus]|uniref:DUF938 domain-containing protein n=1 Tax=Pelagerythrobacter rhizovicinus TaxID=2268576 RepID=A0A4Q2KPC3_9SPHN|nr:DUF938 domain-containing protein [Pelagerythrobacter rhizovicinus]RXZ66357.1 DUF938 domain-containing protein [Pelagerythrobacter rhizovicinus]